MVLSVASWRDKRKLCSETTGGKCTPSITQCKFETNDAKQRERDREKKSSLH